MYLLTIQLKNQDIIDAFEAPLLVSLLLVPVGNTVLSYVLTVPCVPRVPHVCGPVRHGERHSCSCAFCRWGAAVRCACTIGFCHSTLAHSFHWGSLFIPLPENTSIHLISSMKRHLNGCHFFAVMEKYSHHYSWPCLLGTFAWFHWGVHIPRDHFLQLYKMPGYVLKYLYQFALSLSMGKAKL